MVDLKSFRQDWNSNQKELRIRFSEGTTPEEARNLFNTQHAVLHSRKTFGTIDWSYADEIFDELDEVHFRIIPQKGSHSLLWILWHISRIEDITMNILVGGGDQVYFRDDWKKKIGSPVDHTGNEGIWRDLEKITAVIDPAVLLAYRSAVGIATRSIVRETPSESWNDKVQTEHLTRLVDEGAVLPEARGLLDYWGKRSIFELFLMPPTRHIMIYLNEAYSLLKSIEKRNSKG